MVAESDVVVRLTRLLAELRADAAALEARAAETRTLIHQWNQDGGLGRADLVLVAVNLHGWYTALETSLERIAKLLDQSVPSGPTWHVDLLAQMRVDVPGVRPAVIPSDALPDLHELRKFRHFFRNAYVLDLDAARIRQRAEDLLRVEPRVVVALAHLDQHVSHVITTVASG